jgi:hypothetical protein
MNKINGSPMPDSSTRVRTLGIGYCWHYSLNAQVMATDEPRREFVPSVRTAPVRAKGATMSVTWPGTTAAFEQADIYARASGILASKLQARPGREKLEVGRSSGERRRAIIAICK